MGRTGRGCGLQFPVLQYSSRNLCHGINSDKSSYKAIAWQLYKHFLGGYKHFSKKNQPLVLWAEPTGNTHSWEGGKKVFWVSVITISLKASLLKGCNKDSRVTLVVRNSYTLFHKLAVSVVLLNICCLQPGYRCSEYLEYHISFKPS